MISHSSITKVRRFWILFLMLYIFVTDVVANFISDNNSKLSLKRIRSKRWDFGLYQIQENVRGKQKITELRSSFDSRNGSIVYSISGKGANSLFEIDSRTGDLFALYPLDREAQSSYRLNVSARNLQGIEVEDANSITIEVSDKNDNDPQFSRRHYFATVKERSKIGTLVTTITATDQDDPRGSYGQIEYSLLSSSGKNYFMVVRDTGEIKTAVMLDREKEDSYQILIQASDDPGADVSVRRVANTTLTITVLDVNDNPPLFKQRPYMAIVAEDAEIGEKVLEVDVADADLGTNTFTSFEVFPEGSSDEFTVVTVNRKGEIRVKKRLDYEASDDHEYRFRIKAKNISPDPNYLGIMEDVVEVVVRVTDVNEPPEFSKSDFFLEVKENAAVGTLLHSVSARDPEGDSFIYWLIEDNQYFFIDQRSGLISLKRKLDRETKDRYQFKVAAGIKDFFSTATVHVKVLDVNDNPPTPLNDESLELYVCEDFDTTTQVLQPNITMKDADSVWNGGPFRYFSVKNSNYQHFKLVDNRDNTASLYTLHSNFFVSDNREYKFPIRVQDSGKPSLNASYEVLVRVCYCDHTLPPTCDAVPRKGSFHPALLVVLLLFLILLLVVVVMVIVVRGRRKKSDLMFIKDSLSTSDTEVQNFISYTEEGGGEEDTAAFDLTILQRDCPSSVSGSRSRSGFTTPPSTKVSYMSYPRRRPYVSSRDISKFIAGRKAAEDDDDRKLAFDSLQVYGYEGEGSAAGSLSSVCSSTTDSEQDYDYLRDWGPRFQRLADMYGGKQVYSHMSAV